MRTVIFAALAITGLSACLPQSGASDFIFPNGNTALAPPPSGEVLIDDPQQAISASALAEAGIGLSDPSPIETGQLDAAPQIEDTNSSGLSDEQSFDAVAGRETIESDAERRAAQVAARQQVAPTAVPQRPTNTGPNIVEYALNAPNVKGQEWYSRSIFHLQSRFQSNCAGYANADNAQRDFLARGGPERDMRGIDPDGDGFACGWDPAPFIQALRN